MAAGSDLRVFFYDVKGSILQKFDYSHDDKEKEYSSCEMSPSGQTVVVASFNRFRTFSYSTRRKQWEEDGLTEIENLYTITAVSWKKDGSRLVLGSLCGAIEMYDACLKRYKYKGKFEMVYVSPSQVIVKRLSNGERLMLNSLHGNEITKVNVYSDRYLVAHTQSTLLLGDLDNKKKLISELQWQSTGNERFFFDNPGACMIFNAGELTLVEYGRNEPLGQCSTEFVSPHLISLRINERKSEEPIDDANGESTVITENNKKIAYLIDQQTIQIEDLVTHQIVATVNHDSKIDWLELNVRANHLLFRDKKRALNLFDIQAQTRTTLLNLCSYVQWVPRADVVVAQSRADLCVWYSIHSPERVTLFAIKGDVVDIERTKGKTEVVIDEGTHTTYLALNEPLIAFGSAIEDKKFDKAVDILEQCPPSPETDAMWTTLSALALSARRLHIAERCFTAMGDVSKAKYLHKVNKIVDYAEQKLGIFPGTEYFVVKAKLSILDRKFTLAEQLYLEQGLVDEAMEMYQELHKWEDSIRVAEAYNHPQVAELKKHYFQWLIDTRQEEKAALRKEREGDYLEAINLYLKGGLPARAAALVTTHNLLNQVDLLERIADALFAANLFEKAGFFFEKLNNHDRALDAYRRGHAYRAAVDLARSVFPGKVVGLEEEWGDWLVSVGQLDQAINHFIEAGQYTRAIEAAIKSKQFAKASGILDTLDSDAAKIYYRDIGKHYQETLAYDLAEKYYIKGNIPELAVEMYMAANKWNEAYKIASTCMSQREVALLGITQAQRLEAQAKYKEAEELYITIGEQDQAINMYKKAHRFDDMIRLVTTFHKDFLRDTHLHLAQQLEAEGQFKQAEKHYVDGGDWKAAVNMYRANDQWEEAMRVAKQHGGTTASTQVASVWAQSIGGEAGINLLLKFGLTEAAVELAIGMSLFKKAEDICRTSLKKKLPDVFMKHGFALEDEGRYQEAEAEFIKGGLYKEAIDMYVHQRDWLNATRIAESFEPQSVYDIYEAQARYAVECKDYALAETKFVQARKPEEMVKIYKELGRWDDAQKLIKAHMTDKMAYHGEDTKELDPPLAAIRDGEFSRAIDLYLKRTTETTSDFDELEESWENAVKLAMNNVPERTPDVVRTVSRRLVDIKRFQPAAELLEGIGMYKDAIDVYIQGELWEQARILATTKAPEYLNDVIETRISFAVDKGEWEKALELASQQGAELLGKYSAILANQCMQDGKYNEAVNIFLRWGVSPAPQNLVLYKNLAKEVLALSSEVDSEQMVASLKKIFFNLVTAIHDRGDEIAQSHLPEIQQLTLVLHLSALKNTCKHYGLPQLSAKIATSLIRYCNEIPADKAYYEAGICCKEVGALNMAYVFLNRYLDISDMMDEGEASVLENPDFENTDIPSDIPLPTHQYLSEDRREDARSWVLQCAVEDSMNKSLSTRTCHHCGIDTYEASLTCHQCKTELGVCIVTGYPIIPSNKINCTACTKAANREDWNTYVMKMKSCPWCEKAQMPSY